MFLPKIKEIIDVVNRLRGSESNAKQPIELAHFLDTSTNSYSISIWPH